MKYDLTNTLGSKPSSSTITPVNEITTEDSNNLILENGQQLITE